MCRVKKAKMDDGTYQIMVQKTLPRENETRMARGVAEQDVESVTVRLIKEVRGEE